MKQPTTTLSEIRKHGPCSSGWRKLLSYLNKTEADDEPLPFLTILESNGFEDTIWAMYVQPSNPLWRNFAVDCAERVKHLIKDEQSLNTLAVARKHALGEASDSELCAAFYAAWASARDAAGAAAMCAAMDAAGAAARNAARNAAMCAAMDAARNAARASVGVAARNAELAWQTARLKNLLTWGEWRPVEQNEQTEEL